MYLLALVENAIPLEFLTGKWPGKKWHAKTCLARGFHGTPLVILLVNMFEWDFL